MFFAHQEPDHRIVDRMRRAGRGHRGHHPGVRGIGKTLRDRVVLGGEGLGQSLLLMMGKGRQALLAPRGAQLPQPIPIRTLSHL